MITPNSHKCLWIAPTGQVARPSQHQVIGRSCFLSSSLEIDSAKPATALAWKHLKEWALREPVELRSPVPLEVIRACIGLALAWDWVALALLLWLGSSGLMRPGELFALHMAPRVYLECLALDQLKDTVLWP